MKLNILNTSFMEISQFQYNMFTVSSVFIGFSVSTLGILLGLYSEKPIQKAAGTGILLKKANRFTKSLKYMGLSMIIFLLSILDLMNKFDSIFPGINEYFMLLGIISFLIGLSYYLVGSVDLIKVLKIIYRVDDKKMQKEVEDFKRLLKKD